MSYHTNTLTSTQNAPDNVLLAPRKLLNRLMPGRYPVEHIAVVCDMLGCSDLSYYISKLAFDTYDANTPRGFSTDLGEMIERLLISRGHKVKGLLVLHRAHGAKVSFTTNGGEATYFFSKHKHYGLMYSWSDKIDDEMTELTRRFLKSPC